MEKTIRWKVSHPELGSVEVAAPERLRALIMAAQGWGKRWTQIARACTVDKLGDGM